VGLAADMDSIIAVHGMGAHPNDTWCQRVDGEHPTSINWLQDDQLLPSIVPRARIMRYGYDSQWFGDDVIEARASRISQRLLQALQRTRKVPVLNTHGMT